MSPPNKPAVGMLPTERLAYLPITQRKPLKLPKGARMAVWTIVNIEEWDATQTMPRTVLTPPAGGSPMPDIPNWCWHEYGNRVGFWRLLQLFDAFKIPGVVNINGSAVTAYPELVRAMVERHWEFVGHGLTQTIDGAAARPDFGFSRVTGRCERDWQMLPLCQIATPHMSPVLWSFPVTERMQLIEQMIIPFVKNRSVWIVDPLRGRHDVKNRARGICLGARRSGFNRGSCPGQRFVRTFSP